MKLSQLEKITKITELLTDGLNKIPISEVVKMDDEFRQICDLLGQLGKETE